jgi:phosphatidylethanolamine/phosphatidyl-N-methylethanolamine N-methyltransferase
MKEDPSAEHFSDFLAKEYLSQNYSRGLSGFVLTKSRWIVERELRPRIDLSRVLELGAGQFSQAEFISHPFGKITITDLHGPDPELVARLRERFGSERVDSASCDAAKPNFEKGAFDRVIACHLLEHLERPYEVLREWHRLVRPGGVLSVILPCDPGLAWRIGRGLGARRRVERNGIPYDYWMAREHINPFNNLFSYIDYYFPKKSQHWFPLGFRSMDLNLVYGVNIFC